MFKAGDRVCDCVSRINEEIKGHNTKLSVIISLTGEVYPSIEVEKINPRGKRPLIAVPTFCPFCGFRYEDAAKAAA